MGLVPLLPLKLVNFRLFLGLLIILVDYEVFGQEEKKDLYMIGLIPYGGSWNAGPGHKYVIDIALKHINQKKEVLPGYQLNIIVGHSQCNEGDAQNQLIRQIYSAPTKVMIYGPTCSSASVATASFAPYFNLVQMSADAASPSLSDKNMFPNFFRMWPPETSRNPLIVDMMKAFGWRKVATINYLSVLFSSTTDHLISLLAQNNITLLAAEIFKDDPSKAVQALKAVDARIIVGNFYGDAGRRVFCEAYKVGLYGPGIVWHLIGWLTVNWWMTPDVDCTLSEMRTVVDGVLYASCLLDPVDFNVMGVSGYTAKEVDAEIYSVEEAKDYFAISERLHYYDAVWSAALALNGSIAPLKDIGKDLVDFGYDNSEMGKIIKDSMSKVKFEGTLGTIQFDEFGDPLINFDVGYGRNGTREIVGYYVYDDQGVASIQWLSSSRINWIGGRVPSDSTHIVDQALYMNLNVFAALSALSAMGTLLAVIFLLFNIIFRNKRLIKMSSPKMNNMILLGCIMVFTTVFFYEQDEQFTLTFCTVRVFTLTIGFSLVFGSLFSKTWRVHLIFASKKATSVNIQDSQLFLMVFVIVAANTIILVVWVVIAPFETSFITSLSKVLDSADDVVIRYRVSVCVSAHSTTFLGILYVIQGTILAFGAFLAWETKKVTVEALNDSQLIGTCIYNVLILSALGVGLGYVLSHETHLVYALNAAFMILGTVFTECTIFIPKVVGIVRGQADVAPSTMKTDSTTG